VAIKVIKEFEKANFIQKTTIILQNPLQDKDVIFNEFVGLATFNFCGSAP
jgi:hypothetical protein